MLCVLIRIATIYRFQYKNHTKLSQICSQGIFFLGTQDRVRNSLGKRAISVRAIEALPYFENVPSIPLRHQTQHAPAYTIDCQNHLRGYFFPTFFKINTLIQFQYNHQTSFGVASDWRLSVANNSKNLQATDVCF